MTRLPRIPVARHATAGRTLWLISITDLMSLLLAFFVLMYAMGEPDTGRWQQMTGGLSARSMAPTPSDVAPEARAAFNAATLEPHSAVNLDYLSALLRTQIADQPDLAGLVVLREDDRVVIVLPGEAMFEHGGVLLSDRGRRALFLLGDVVARVGNRIEVLGQAGREGVDAAQGWERGLTRAVAVSAALRQAGYPRDLVARSAMTPRAARGAVDGRVDLVVREHLDRAVPERGM